MGLDDGTNVGLALGLPLGETLGLAVGPSIEHTPSGTLTITFTEDNWGTGYCRNVSITNISQETVTWTVTMNTPGTIDNSWNAKVEDLGNDMTKFSGADWGTEITAGGEYSFGFCAQI